MHRANVCHFNRHFHVKLYDESSGEKKKKSILISLIEFKKRKKKYSEQTRLMGPKIAFLVQCLEVIYQYQKEAQTQTLALCWGPALGQSLNDQLFCLTSLSYYIPAI